MNHRLWKIQLFILVLLIIASQSFAQKAIFSAERITAAAIQHLQDHFPFPIIADPINSITDVILESADARAEFRYVSQSPQNPFHTIEVTFFCENKECNRLRLQFNVQKKVLAPIALKAIAKGSKIQSREITWDTIISNLHIEYPDPSEITGKIAVTDIDSGSVITAEDLQDIEFLPVGSVVTVLLRTPHIQIRTQGKILEEALPGKEIKVLLSRAREPVKGIYVGNKTVEIR